MFHGGSIEIGADSIDPNGLLAFSLHSSEESPQVRTDQESFTVDRDELCRWFGAPCVRQSLKAEIEIEYSEMETAFDKFRTSGIHCEKADSLVCCVARS